MNNISTIQISVRLKKNLDAFKDYPRETYEDVIEKLVLRAKEDEESKLELSDETLKDIEEARADFKHGRVYTLKQVRKELGI